MTEPLFLPEVQKALPAGERGELIRRQTEAGLPMPGIYHLFAFRPERNAPLMQFTQGVMRGPSPLTPGQRELIAAYTSRLNRCPY